MVARADIAALLALGAAFFIAMGDVIHQRTAHDVTDQPVGYLGLFARFLRDRQWWLGSLVSALGFALQAAALGLGSVLMVQALLVTSLLFALPINARAARRPVGRMQWETLRPGPGGWVILIVSVAAMVVATVALARSEAGAGAGAARAASSGG